MTASLMTEPGLPLEDNSNPIYFQLSKTNDHDTDINDLTQVSATERIVNPPSKTKNKRKAKSVPEHIEVIHVKITKYKCKICKKTFDQMYDTCQHMTSAWGKKLFKCSLCNKEFSKKSKLDMHLRSHSGETPFRCRYCGKGFKFNVKLKRHEMIHSGQILVSCNVCDKVLNRTSLKMHLLNHTNKKPYECDKCGKSFLTKFYLERHLYTHTEAKSFVCECCGKTFSRKYNLSSHMKRHLEVTSYPCQLCQASFKYQKDLKRHSAKHSDLSDVRCECTICETTFQRKDNLLRHMKSTHPDAPLPTDRSLNKTQAMTKVRSVITSSDSAEKVTNRTEPEVRKMLRPRSVIVHTKSIHKMEHSSTNCQERESIIKSIKTTI